MASHFLLGLGLFPEISGDRQGIDVHIHPPIHLIAGIVQLAMVDAAERDRELVADLLAHGARLRKLQMMGVGRRPTADQTGLGCDKP